MSIEKSFLDYSPKIKNCYSIEGCKLEYIKPKDPVEIIKGDNSLSNQEKFDKIKDLLVNEYKILDGNMAYILAATALGDDGIIKRFLKKQNKLQKRIKRSKKK